MKEEVLQSLIQEALERDKGILNLEEKNLNNNNLEYLASYFIRCKKFELPDITIDLRTNPLINHSEIGIRSLITTIQKVPHIKKVLVDIPEYQKRINQAIQQSHCDCPKCHYKKSIFSPHHFYYQNNWVIIRTWLQHHSSGIATDGCTVIREIFKGQVGHISFQTPNSYISLSTENKSSFISETMDKEPKGSIKLLQNDFMEWGRIADLCIALHTVDAHTLDSQLPIIKANFKYISSQKENIQATNQECAELAIKLMATGTAHMSSSSFSSNLLTEFKELKKIEYIKGKTYTLEDIAKIVTEHKEQEIKFLRHSGLNNEQIEALDMIDEQYFIPDEIDKSIMINIKNRLKETISIMNSVRDIGELGSKLSSEEQPAENRSFVSSFSNINETLSLNLNINPENLPVEFKPVIKFKNVKKVQIGNKENKSIKIKTTSNNAEKAAIILNDLADKQYERDDKGKHNQLDIENKHENEIFSISFNQVEGLQCGHKYKDGIIFEEIPAVQDSSIEHASPQFSNSQTLQTTAPSTNMQLITPLVYQPLTDDNGEYFRVSINYSKMSDDKAKRLQDLLQEENGLGSSSCFREPEKTRTRKGYIQRLDFDNKQAAIYLCEFANQFISNELENEEAQQNNCDELKRMYDLGKEFGKLFYWVQSVEISYEAERNNQSKVNDFYGRIYKEAYNYNYFSFLPKKSDTNLPYFRNSFYEKLKNALNQSKNIENANLHFFKMGIFLAYASNTFSGLYSAMFKPQDYLVIWIINMFTKIQQDFECCINFLPINFQDNIRNLVKISSELISTEPNSLSNKMKEQNYKCFQNELTIIEKIIFCHLSEKKDQTTISTSLNNEELQKPPRYGKRTRS